MTTIYLVRHGITPANRENRFAGRTAEELHAEGIEQMLRLGEQLRQQNIAKIYCGPARRTVQSAEILGGLLQVPHYPLAGLDEIRIPHWDGLTKDEIRHRYGAEYPTWLDAPHAFSLPGCETLAQVQKRAVAAVAGLLAGQDAERLLVVSHLIVLRCLVLYYQGLDIGEFRSIKIDNGSLLCLSAEEKGGYRCAPCR